VSEYGLESPPEQGTYVIEAEAHTNDKWAQRTAQPDKPRLVGPTGQSTAADGPMGPTALSQTRGGLALDEEVGSSCCTPWLLSIITKGG